MLPFINNDHEIGFRLHSTLHSGNGTNYPADSFSPDGQHLFFSFYNVYDDLRSPRFHVYNFNDSEIRLIDDSSEFGAGWVKALTDALYVYSIGIFNPLGDLAGLETLRLYDLQQNQTYPIQGDGMFGVASYGVNRLENQFAYKRFVLFYSSFWFQENDYTNQNAGRLWVMDTQTSQ